MNDAARRTLRTFLQVGFVTVVIQLLVAFGVKLTAEQQAAIIAVATPLVTLAQNLVEDAGGNALTPK
jgi:hypothetical protein